MANAAVTPAARSATGTRGTTAGPPLGGEHPGPRLVVEVVAREVGERAFLAEPRERAVDDRGVGRAHRGGAHPEAVGHSGAEPLGHDVSLGGEAGHALLAVWVL